MKTKTTKNIRPDDATVLATIKAHATTKTYTEIAGMLGLSLSQVAAVGYRAGFSKPNVQGARRALVARQRAVIEAHAMTHTLREMGRMLGITKERVRQLCEKWGIVRRNLMCSPLRWMSNRELRKLIRQPEKTLGQIAAEAGVVTQTLSDELRRRGIERFTKLEHKARLFENGLRICYRCKRAKPLEQFPRDSLSPVGRNYRCLECGRAYANAWRKGKGNAKR